MKGCPRGPSGPALRSVQRLPENECPGPLLDTQSTRVTKGHFCGALSKATPQGKRLDSESAGLPCPSLCFFWKMARKTNKNKDSLSLPNP